MPSKQRAAPGGEQGPPGDDRSQELLDAMNALAWGVTSFAQHVPQILETLETISQQFAVLIAVEAERRNTTAERLTKEVLIGLSNRVFRGRRS